MVDDIPHAVWSGEFTIGRVVMKCHLLSDGTRIVEQDSTEEFWNAMSENSLPDGELHEFLNWMTGKGN